MATNIDFGTGQKVTSQDTSLEKGNIIELGEGIKPDLFKLQNKLSIGVDDKEIPVDNKYPALANIDEVDYNFEKLDMFGIQDYIPFGNEIKVVKDRFRDVVNFKKLTPLVQTKNFYDDRDDPGGIGRSDDVDMLYFATGVKNKEGNIISFPGETLKERASLPIDQKFAFADRQQAVSFVEQWGKTTQDSVENEIPFDKALTEELAIPAIGNVASQNVLENSISMPEWLYTPIKDDILNPDGKTPYQLYIDGGGNSDLTKIFFGRQLNRMLIKQGITDKRTRLGIIRQEKSFGAALGIMATDLDKIGGNVREALRFPISMVGWLGGEIMQALIGEGEDGNLMDSAERHKVYERYLPEMAVVIQDRLAQNNVSVTYQEAQLMARNYSGIGTAAIGMLAEIAVPSSIAMRVKSAFGKKSQEQFEKYYQQVKGPNGTARKSTDAQVFAQFIDMKARSNLLLTSPLILANVFKVSQYTKGIARGADNVRVAINRIMVTNRSAAGMQLKDAAQLLPENRAEVAALIGMHTSLVTQRAAQIRRAKIRNSDPDLSASIKELDEQIEATTIEIQRMAALSKTPRYMREANVSNRAMIIGGAVGNQIAQQYGFDPQLGELGGLFTGLFLRNGGNKAGSGIMWVKRNILGGITGRTMEFATDLAQKMTTFSPEFAAAVKARMSYFQDLRIILAEAGVPPELLKSSFAKMSGLSYLQILEEGDRLNIRAKSLLDFKKLETLQENAGVQVELINELRSAIATMEGVEGVKNAESAQNLLKMMKATLQDAESSVKQLDSDINTISKFGEKRVLDYIGGKLDGDSLLDVTTNDRMDTALINIGINKTKLIPKSEVNQINTALNNSHKEVATETSKIANLLLAQGKLTVASSTTQRANKSFIDSKKLTPSLFNTAGKLTSMLIESKYATRHNVAGTNYRLLDNGTFVTADNKVVGANPYVDGTNALFDFIESVAINSDTYGIGLLNSSKGVPTGQQTKIFKVFDEIVGTFISEAANKKGMDPVDMKRMLLDSLRDSGKYNEKLSDNLNIAQELKKSTPDGASLNTVKLSFDQLKEFRSALSHLSWKATQSENLSAASTYGNIDEILKGQMNSFVVDTVNGPTAIGELYVKRNGKLDPVSTVLKDANSDWSSFKSHFFRGTVANWMGKGKGGFRKKGKINADNPLGIEYGVKPEQWLNVKSFLSKTPQERLGIFEEMSNGLGELQTVNNQKLTELHGTYRINPDSADGKAFGAILNNVVAEYMNDVIKNSSGPVSYNMIQKKLDELQDMFVGTTRNGERKSLINIRKVYGEQFSFKPEIIGEEKYNKQMSKADSAIKTNVDILADKGRDIRDGIIAAKTILAKYNPENVAKGNLTEMLFENGGLRLENFKESLNTIRKRSGKGEYSNDQVNQIMDALLSDTIDNVVFVPTGNFSTASKKTSGVYEAPDIIMETDMDINKLKQLIGYGDEVKAGVIKDVIGEKKYKVYTAIIEFGESNKLRPAEATNLTGVPRAFSLESYISRFYSINRGVISARYVGTEAILQQMRLKNMKYMKAMLSSPEAAELFMKSIQSGKPLTAVEEEAFFNALAVGVAYVSTHHEVINRVDVGNQYKIYQEGNKNITSKNYPEYGKSGFTMDNKNFDKVKRLNEAIQRQKNTPFPLGSNTSYQN